MTKLAYLECPTGIAGDMCLGALIHAGVPLEYLTEKLALLGIADEYRLWAERVHRNGQEATKLHIELVASHLISSNLATGKNLPASNLHKAATHLPHSTKTANSQSEHHSHSHHSQESDSGSGDRPNTGAIALTNPETNPKTNSDSSPNPNPASVTVESPVLEQPTPSTQNAAHQHGERHLLEIEHLIMTAGLPPRAAAWSLAVFRRLAEAEGAVHGIAPEQVHFHEVGATDAIVDIVGTCLGLDWLNIDQLYCSPMPTGGGTILAAHGQLPVPAPAVLKLWEMRQIPIYSNGIERELVTPTGAAIATTLATQFGTPPSMTLQRVGLGAGSRNLPIPNILRLWVGEAETKAEGSRKQQETAPDNHSSPFILHSSYPDTDPAQETISVLETQIDDLNPQAIGYIFEALFAEGALDVFTQAIGMKKSRPGILLTVICPPKQVAACESVIFRETTTLGIRRLDQPRTVLHRTLQKVELPYGTVRIKVARQEKEGAIANIQPEYEDCAQLARQFHIPWQEIHRLALFKWHQKNEAHQKTAP